MSSEERSKRRSMWSKNFPTQFWNCSHRFWNLFSFFSSFLSLFLLLLLLLELLLEPLLELFSDELPEDESGLISTMLPPPEPVPAYAFMVPCAKADSPPIIRA